MDVRVESLMTVVAGRLLPSDSPKAVGSVVGDAAVARRVPLVSDDGHRRAIGEDGFVAQPCFFHRECGGAAEIEKQGKAVCRVCGHELNGVEYPLRGPGREPLYSKPEELVLQLEMKERGRKRGGE